MNPEDSESEVLQSLEVRKARSLKYIRVSNLPRLEVKKVQRVSDPEILEVLRVSRVSKSRRLELLKVPRVSESERLRVPRVPRVWDSRLDSKMTLRTLSICGIYLRMKSHTCEQMGVSDNFLAVWCALPFWGEKIMLLQC